MRLSLADFAAHAATAVRSAFPGWIVEHPQPTLLVVRRPTAGDGELDESGIALADYYHAYWRTGDEMRELERVVAGVRQWFGLELAQTTFDEVQARLLPKIERVDSLQHMTGGPIYDLFLAGLLACLTVDTGHTISYVLPSHCTQWRTPAPRLWDRARENMRRKAQAVSPTITMRYGIPVAMVTALDGYSASALLVPDVVASWIPAPYNTDLLVCIPHRDVLACMPRVPQAGLVLSPILHEAYESRYPLTTTVYALRDGRLRPAIQTI